MLFPAEQAFVGRDDKRAPLKTPAWEANVTHAHCVYIVRKFIINLKYTSTMCSVNLELICLFFLSFFLPFLSALGTIGAIFICVVTATKYFQGNYTVNAEFVQ